MRVIAKFGGTSVADGERVNRAANSIASAVADGHEMSVVVSAMGGTTDRLLKQIQFDASEEDRAEIVSMGERTAVRMLKGALEARGIDSLFLEPGREEWPIITDAYGEVDVPETRRRGEAIMDRMSEGVVPVLTGFLAEDHEGSITTLGRGGSDTTAVMLGNYTDADEVIIVTDVEGVMTGDPNVVEGARNVGEITVDELRNLSFRGAEVIAPSALTYKTGGFDVRVVHHQHADLLTGGTTIEGEFESLVDMQERSLACVTVAGRAIRNQPGVLSALAGTVAEVGVNIQTVSSGLDSVTFYVDADDAPEAETVLHERVIENEVLSSVTVDEGLASIRITGGEIQRQTGAVNRLLAPLVGEHIFVHDIVTSATSVSVFVEWDDREAALRAIQDVL
ncbi:MAG: aspartate kinase [halophilic archaeon J07HX64]|nr:MAG: aspartate kinase [halophilic archaeon J07HX64]